MADNDDLLSQDEIDSLLKGVSGDEDDEQPEQLGGKHIKPFDPATQARVVRGRLHSFDIINERFARDFRTSLFNLIRRSADITVSGFRIEKYTEFTRNLPIPANINLFAMKPLRGHAVMVFPPDLVFLIIDSLFGGDGRFLTKSEGREFTRTEQRVIQRVLSLALNSYAEGWKRIHDIDMEYLRSEMQIKFANLTNTNNEIVVNSTFHVEVGTFGADFHICMPYAMIEPLHEKLSGPLYRGDPDEERQRVAQVASEVKQSSVRLTADFTSVKTSLRQVQHLAVGDVLPIDLPGEITARVDDVPVFKCDFGSLNTHKALRVTRVIDHSFNAPSQESMP